MMARLVGVLALLAATAACEGMQAPACTLEARAGINVTVVDQATGAAIAQASGTARENAFSETLQSFAPGDLFGVFEREGTYEVTVSAPGYEAWRTEDVIVRPGECHVIPVRITARLVRPS